MIPSQGALIQDKSQEQQTHRSLVRAMKAIDAGNQVIFASNYPLPDMDVPSVIWDLEFLNEQQKRNILGENARKLFKL